MANFNKAYQLAMGHEGRIANNPNDLGGMTWKGIARHYHPHWQGWTIIDSAIKQYGWNVTKINNHLAGDHFLESLVQDFYLQGYWMPILGDDLPQVLANQIFQITINMSGDGKRVKRKAVKFMQRAINFYNYQSHSKKPLFTDITVDGLMGQQTLSAMRAVIRRLGVAYLQKAIEAQQVCYYIKSTERRHKNRTFSKGWVGRATIRKLGL